MTNFAHPTLLLVEDDPGHAMLIEMNLAEVLSGADVLKADDGQIALDMVDELRQTKHPLYLVILLDLNLPTMDGYQVLQTLKSNPATRTIPVVVMTSTDDSREIARCYELGCNAYLQKSIEYPAFASAVKNLAQFLSVIQLPFAN